MLDVPGLCSLFPRQRSTRTLASGPGRFRQGGRVQIEGLETVSLETEGETVAFPAAAPHRQTVSVGEMGSPHVAHLTQERSKHGQDGQMPDPGPGYSPVAPYPGPS